MKDSINLVSKKRAPGKFHKRFLYVSVAFFSVMFLISSGLIAYRFYLTTQLNSLRGVEEQLISNINADIEKKVKFLTVRERLSEIQKILGLRKNVNAKIVNLSNALPVDVGINQIEGDESKILIRVSASDLASLNNLIEQRIEEYISENTREIKRIEMGSFGLNPNSLQYEASFTIEFI